MKHVSGVLGTVAGAGLLGLVGALSLFDGVASPASLSEAPNADSAPMALEASTAPAASAAPGTAPSPAPRDSAVVAWTPSDVVQGTLFRVALSPKTGAIRSVEASFAGEPLHFFEEESGAFAALAAAPVDARGSLDLELEITYESGASATRSVSIPIVPGDYRMERLTVAPEFGAPPPPEIQARINDENARAMAVSRGSHGTPRMWELPIVPPRDGGITSGFGSGRMFNDQVQSRHTGTDFGGGVGAPVVAPAHGRVALVDQFYLGGNVIYLDHGAGLVTAYLHLSEQNVQTGDIVEPGQVIGRVGATGRVTGPHLHWIVRYGVVSVDGLSLLALE